ncbi:MAG TPA: 3-oxoacyl-[acyl-carrier-protein] synthase III C-terminal domain-containing protein [Motilibacteraceae bacterium]|nr:3-oxoacyl-[acyl-carrier-protein] synthase III C-terminal domain-containing protein [Motilibacteraceae bacterium]
MSTIAAVSGVLPDHRHEQGDITALFGDVVLGDSPERRPVLERFHANAGVKARHLALPLEEYSDLGGFGRSNDAFIEVGLDLAERAVRTALVRVGLRPADVDLVMTVTVTGLAAPSLEARLAPRVGFRQDVKRVPIFGLGCVAGAAGISRVHDHLVGHPDDVAVLLSVELCSLTLQADDTATPNLVASGLFGDGAAAVVLVGERRAEQLGLSGPRVVDTRSRLYPGTERVMGWDVGGGGLKIVLAASVAEVIETHLGDDVRGFLGAHGLKVDDIAAWVSHPGGPKVLEAVQAALGLPDGALDVTWQCLAEHGNLSSASVLHVLERTLAERRPPAGQPGVLMAMGPGFAAELVLLEW